MIRRPASTRCSRTPSAAPTRSPSSYAGKRRRARRARASTRRCASSPRSRSSSAARAPTRTSRSRSTPPTPRAARCCSASQEQGTAIETKLLFFELEWAALDDERADELLATDGLDFAPPPPARRARRYRPHLLTEPEEKLLTEKAVTGAQRLGAPVRRADSAIRSSSPDGDEPVALEVALVAALRPRPRGAPRRRRGGHRRARAGPAHARLHLQHAARRQGDRRPAARLPALARGAQPLQRGLRRVGRRRWSTPSARRYELAAPLVPAEGAAARRRPARRLRPHGRGRRRTTSRSRWPEAKRARARLLRVVLAASSATSSSRFFDERWIDAPVRPGKRGGAFCAYTRAVRAPVRDAQLHGPAPRRADARARARPRRARGAGARAGRLPHGDAADAGRDRLGVRRDARLRPAARATRRPPSRGSSLLAESIEGSIATVFRQVAMNRFEHLGPHRAPRRGRAVGRPLRRAVGASRRRSCSATRSRSPRATARWWSYVPHFIDTPGYVYAYAYGQLLALSVYRRYEEEGDGLRARLPRAAARGRLALARGARARSSASTSPTRASGTPASTSSSASSTRPRRPPRAPNARGV